MPTKEPNFPSLMFFRSTPPEMAFRPPLASSIQNLETCFLLIALGRFPHALVVCASAIESSMKAALGLPVDDKVGATQLYKKAQQHYLPLVAWDKALLEDFRENRNRIVHYGFSPQDDGACARLLLSVGIPFVRACYKEMFGFDLMDGLVVDVAGQLSIALRVHDVQQDVPEPYQVGFWTAFGHNIRWSLRPSFTSAWEAKALILAEEGGHKFERCEHKRRDLERLFAVSWAFDCPICGDPGSFVGELDGDRLERGAIALIRAACVNCSLFIRNVPGLADALVEQQAQRECNAILREYGVA